MICSKNTVYLAISEQRENDLGDKPYTPKLLILEALSGIAKRTFSFTFSLLWVLFTRYFSDFLGFGFINPVNATK
jgi:hypothetical protein